MPDFRSAQPQTPAPASFSSYKVNRDKRGGYRVELNWKYNEAQPIVGFRVYKSKLPKPLLARNYKLSQLALEKLSGNKNFSATSNLLYDKSYFAQNSKVSFFKSNSNRYDSDERKKQKYDYYQMGFILKNPKNEYHFIDHGVKFGETYAYILTAVTRNLKESDRTAPLILNVEEIQTPEDIKNVRVSEKNTGILIEINSKSKDIKNFHIYRKRSEDLEFELLNVIESKKETEIYLDDFVFPGNEYIYKIYAEDFFGNISWHSEQYSIEFLSNILNKGAIRDPMIKISFDGSNIRFDGTRNHPDVRGYRIERKDVWRFEENFEPKQYNSKPWPNVIPFDDNGNMFFIDYTANLGRSYQYRVSSVGKNSVVQSIFVFPPIVANENVSISSWMDVGIEEFQPKLLNFDANLLSTKQVPIHCKFSWKIEGKWSFVKLIINEEEKVIDNLHDFVYYSKFKINSKYLVRLEVFDLNGQKTEQAREIRIST